MESGESTLGEENERNVQNSVRGELFEEKDLEMKDRGGAKL